MELTGTIQKNKNADVWYAPITYVSGYCYFASLIDDTSRCTWRTI